MKNETEIIVVAGLARCGTSLAMQMLHIAGVPIYGPEHAVYPAFEHPATMISTHPETSWLADARGKAIKVIDPHLNVLPAGHAYRVIWLDRDSVQQAKSTLKFLGAMFGTIGSSRDNRRAMESGLKRDRARALACLRRVSNQILMLRFETLINDPKSTALTVAEFVGIDDPFVPMMAHQVVKRSPNCYSGLLEMDLLRRTA